jgi:hypothetical protein
MKKVLFERFPDLSLFLTLTPFEPLQLFKNRDGMINARTKKGALYAKNIIQEVRDWFTKLHLDQVEVLYIYGLGLGYYYELLKTWLKEKKERAVVFIEDDLAVIDACFRANAVDLLEDAQVHIRFIPRKKHWKETLESLVHLFLSDRIAFTALESYQKQFPQKIAAMRLYLQRSSALFDAFITEVLNSHRLFANLYPNFKQLPLSFYVNTWEKAFQNIPAIICGAGPSLTHVTAALKDLTDRALIIAGGSTLAALTSQGVIPHLGIALDPNPVEFDRLKKSSAFEMPFIYAPRLFPEVFSLFNGPFGYMRSDTGGEVESWLEKKLHLKEKAIGPDLGREALSVTTLATSLAHALGCNPILFVGVDLAFTEGKSYAAGIVADERSALKAFKEQPKAIHQLLRKKDARGKFVYTLIKWVMESATLSHYAKKHPETQFINCTEGGIGFSDIPYLPFEKAVKTYCQNSYDLAACVHVQIQKTRVNMPSFADLHLAFEELQSSLERSKEIVEKMLHEKSLGKITLLEMDLHDEIAYDCCLRAAGAAIERITARFQSDCFEEKYQQFQTMIQTYLEIFQKTKNSFV